MIPATYLEEISEPENQLEVAALAYEFWQRWNIRRGPVPSRTEGSDIRAVPIPP